MSGLLERIGFVHEETAYIAHAELIMRYRKPLTPSIPQQAPSIALAARQA